MLRVGITGGIGSGKSTACAIFEQLGVPVFHADQETKEIYASNPLVRQQLIDEFGPEIYLNGGLNRPLLAKLVFGNPTKLQWLNQLIHPLVNAKFENWCLTKSQHAYVVKEAAILFESGSYKNLHQIIGVLAPEDLRISRVMERDGVKKSEVIARINQQMNQEELAKKCDYILHNDTEKSLVEQVLQLHKTLVNLAAANPNPELTFTR
jgi:dephospho-CoA kinase